MAAISAFPSGDSLGEVSLKGSPAPTVRTMLSHLGSYLLGSAAWSPFSWVTMTL